MSELKKNLKYEFINNGDFFCENYNLVRSSDFIGADMKAYIIVHNSILKKNKKYKIIIEEI